MTKFMVIASQFATTHKHEVALVKAFYKIVKAVVKVLDLGFSLI